MIRRKLGKTEWEISVISFGAIKLPQLSQRECDTLLNRAIDLGINFIDTADCYGDSEEKIGKALGRRRGEFYLSTKVDERDGPGVTKKLERCLRRLRTDWIDLVLFHDVRESEYDRIFREGGLQALQKARERGHLSHIGISIHQSLPLMRKAIHSGLFSVLMVAYSPMDEDRLSSDLIPLAHEEGVGLIAMKPLAGGRLGSSAPDWNSDLFEGESCAQVSLRYVLTLSHLTCAIPGMTNLRELEENVRVGKNPRELTPEQIRRFMDWIGEAGKGFCRNCGYCLPCPEGIPIPDLFRIEAYDEHYRMKKWAAERYRQLSVNAGSCTSCERCVPRCPYGVPIPQRLKDVHQRFQ